MRDQCFKITPSFPDIASLIRATNLRSCGLQADRRESRRI